jgi:glycosyltransferase involved in cell wall biosynthesis
MTDRPDDTPDLSIVIPLHNEADNVDPLIDELFAVLGEFGLGFEVILVDDGSTDDTFARLRRRAADEPRLRLIRFARNYGQTAGLSAGFHAARAATVITLDGDLQNDPRDIPAVLAKMDEGYDVVSGWRKDRKDTFINRTLPSRIANRLISQSTGVSLHDYGCALKAYRRTVLQRFELYGQLHRFLPALCAMAGARVGEIVVNHRARERGATKYGIGRTLTVILDLTTVKFLLSYGAHPIRVFGMISFLSAALGATSLLGTIAMKVWLGVDMTGNPLLYLAMLGAILAVQFLLMGIIAEMLTRTYHEAQGKRPYIVTEVVND